jgi:hypothetical protein
MWAFLQHSISKAQFVSAGSIFLFISWPSFYVLGARVGLTLVGRATQDGPRCNLASFSSSVYNYPILWKHRGAVDLLVSHMFLFPFAPPYSYVIFHSVGASARRFLCRRQLFSDQISISSGFKFCGSLPTKVCFGLASLDYVLFSPWTYWFIAFHDIAGGGCMQLCTTLGVDAVLGVVIAPS